MKKDINSKIIDEIAISIAKRDAKRRRCLDSKAESDLMNIFNSMQLIDKIKIVCRLKTQLCNKIDKVIEDTYEPDYSGCDSFFIEYHWDNEDDIFVSAVAWNEENISIPLKWLVDGYDYMADYRKECADIAHNEELRLEQDEREEYLRLKAKYGGDYED